MDAGIIFLIIIVIIIIIAIILIIFANRNNTQNLLLTLPNYRIQDVASGSYLALINTPNFNQDQGQAGQIPIYTLSSVPFVPFWGALASGGLSVTDPLGLWKINILNKINTTEAEVQIINDVYFTESPGLTLGPLSATPNDQFFTPNTPLTSATVFIMTTVAPNTFNLRIKEGNFAIIIERNNNLLTYNPFNVNIKPAVFKLTLV